MTIGAQTRREKRFSDETIKTFEEKNNVSKHI